ncbi:MAG: hypothetical protein H6698_00145 [Myxococcales bacterium]|nr:hypothetical protein [Myxococcales bacterium]MCB9532721.1 hypothetical protein [Myxococcales bacterium]
MTRASLSVLGRLAVAVALVAGCGGATSVGTSGRGDGAALASLPADAGRDALLAFVPSDSFAGVVWDGAQAPLDDYDAEWDAQPASTIATFRETFGVDRPDELGLSLDRPAVMFADSTAVVIVAGLDDRAEFEALLDRLEGMHPDTVGTPLQVDDLSFRAYGDASGYAYVGAVGEWATLILPLTDADLDDFDAASVVREVLNRRPDASALGDEATRQQLGRRSGGRLPYLAGWVDVGELVTAWDGAVDAERYTSAAQRGACEAAGLVVAERVPRLEMTGWSVRDSAQTTGTAELRVQLSPTAAGRAAAILPPAPVLPDAPSAIRYSLGLDAVAAIAAATADPALADCPGIAALAGGLGSGAQQLRGHLEEIERFYSGWAAAALYGVRGGLSPSIDLVVGVASGSPIDLTEQIQSGLASAGASGHVDATAPFTTIDYELQGQRIRLMQLDDRVVLAVGDVPAAASNGLATAAVPGSGAFFRGDFDGDALADAFESAMNLLTMFTGESMPEDELQVSIDSMRRVVSMTVEGVVSDGAVVFTTVSTVSNLTP